MNLELIRQQKDLEKRAARLESLETASKWQGTSFPTDNLYHGRIFWLYNSYPSNKATQYYYSSGEFSGPAATWYKAGVGVNDSFPGADTAVIPPRAETGQSWLPRIGTWGISSNRLYEPTPTNGHLIVIEAGTSDPTCQMISTGTRNSGVNLTLNDLVFRYLDDNNFLLARAYNGNIELAKYDGGAFASLTLTATATPDNTDLTITVVAQSDSVLIYLGGVLKITHTLAAANYKYLAGTKCGVLQDFAGAPAFPARVDNFIVRQAA